MDGLFDTLDDFASDSSKLPAVRMVAKRGLTILKKYYGKTDESAIFRIAMSKSSIQLFCLSLIFHLVLHPAFKTTYFRTHKWPEEWITTAVDLLRADWEKNYKPKPETASRVSGTTERQVCAFPFRLIVN
jgi:hypothetical protein